MSQPFLGQITVFPYSFAPLGWADCAGQLLPITQYTALFSLIGTYYGGNGTSNFQLPDLQGRVSVSQGPLTGGSTYVIGEEGGQENVSLTSGQLGSHNHGLSGASAHGASNNPAGNLLAIAATSGLEPEYKGLIYNAAPADTTLVPKSIGQAGGTAPHNNVQPFLVLRYCIAMQGVFPARS